MIRKLCSANPSRLFAQHWILEEKIKFFSFLHFISCKEYTERPKLGKMWIPIEFESPNSTKIISKQEIRMQSYFNMRVFKISQITPVADAHCSGRSK